MWTLVPSLTPSIVLFAAACYPQAKTGEESDSDDMDVETGEVKVEGRQRKKHGKHKQHGSDAQLKTKGWVLKKKAQMRKKGYTSIPVDTKYTGRKRKKGF